MTEATRCPVCGARLQMGDTTCRHCGAGLHAARTMTSAPGAASREPEDSAFEELRAALTPAIQVLRPLGSGGLGSVYLGRDPALRRLVAIKVLSPHLAHDPSVRARFQREAESAAAVAHPNVVGVHQVGELPQSRAAFLVMQFVEGRTLRDEFGEGKPRPEARAKRITGEVAAALAAAHARGLVHRDIKPANIMVDGETGRTIVLDFGISAVLQPTAVPGDRLTAEGASIGTPEYMSPEQAASQS